MELLKSSEVLDLRTLKTSIDGKANSSHTHNYAGSSSAGGAANSANTLATARTINGTSFNGSTNITTANWGTSRTLTIGNAAKSVDGSTNTSWSLAEMGVGTLSNLQTTNKTDIVSAINELNVKASKIDTTNNNLNNLQTRVNNGQNVKMTEDNGACRGIPNNNANDINVTGFWMGSNVANAPAVRHDWVYIESKVHNNLYQNQIATDLHDSSKRWTRHKTSGTWSDWRSL